MIKEYLSMRKEIWSGLAARIEEEWSVVEEKVGLLYFRSFPLKRCISTVYAYASTYNLVIVSDIYYIANTTCI